MLWAKSGVGTGDMALDSAGNVYTTGLFSGTFDADPGPGTFNLTAGGQYDVLISVLNSAGNFVWAGAIGGDDGNGIAVDGSGSVYTTGVFQGTADFDPGTGTYAVTSMSDTNSNAAPDAFIAKLVPTDTLQSSSTFESATISADLIAAIDYVLWEETSGKRKR